MSVRPRGLFTAGKGGVMALRDHRDIEPGLRSINHVGRLVLEPTVKKILGEFGDVGTLEHGAYWPAEEGAPRRGIGGYGIPSITSEDGLRVIRTMALDTTTDLQAARLAVGPPLFPLTGAPPFAGQLPQGVISVEEEGLIQRPASGRGGLLIGAAGSVVGGERPNRLEGILLEAWQHILEAQSDGGTVLGDRITAVRGGAADPDRTALLSSLIHSRNVGPLASAALNLTRNQADATGWGLTWGAGAQSGGVVAAPGRTIERVNGGNGNGNGKTVARGGGAAAVDAVLAYLAAEEKGGPISQGRRADQHQLGVNAFGVPINSNHLDIDALWEGRGGDGPKEVSSIPYPETRQGMFPVHVHESWDAIEPHDWVGGQRRGKWRRWTTSTIYTPPDPGPRTPEDPGPTPGPGEGPGRVPTGPRPPRTPTGPEDGLPGPEGPSRPPKGPQPKTDPPGDKDPEDDGRRFVHWGGSYIFEWDRRGKKRPRGVHGTPLSFQSSAFELSAAPMLGHKDCRDFVSDFTGGTFRRWLEAPVGLRRIGWGKQTASGRWKPTKNRPPCFSDGRHGTDGGSLTVPAEVTHRDFRTGDFSPPPGNISVVYDATLPGYSWHGAGLPHPLSGALRDSFRWGGDGSGNLVFEAGDSEAFFTRLFRMSSEGAFDVPRVGASVSDPPAGFNSIFAKGDDLWVRFPSGTEVDLTGGGAGTGFPLADDVVGYWGDSNDFGAVWDTGETLDCMKFAVLAGGNERVVFTNTSRIGTDLGMPAASTPTLSVHSGSSSAANRFDLRHDGSNAYIESFDGSLLLEGEGGNYLEAAGQFFGTNTPHGAVVRNTNPGAASAVEWALSLYHDFSGSALVGHGTGLIFDYNNALSSPVTAGIFQSEWSSVSVFNETSDFVWRNRDGGTMTDNMRLRGDGVLEVRELASKPSAPPTGWKALYARSLGGGDMYEQNSAGTETNLADNGNWVGHFEQATTPTTAQVPTGKRASWWDTSKSRLYFLQNRSAVIYGVRLSAM